MHQYRRVYAQCSSCLCAAAPSCRLSVDPASDQAATKPWPPQEVHRTDAKLNTTPTRPHTVASCPTHQDTHQLTWKERQPVCTCKLRTLTTILWVCFPATTNLLLPVELENSRVGQQQSTLIASKQGHKALLTVTCLALPAKCSSTNQNPTMATTYHTKGPLFTPKHAASLTSCAAAGSTSTPGILSMIDLSSRAVPPHAQHEVALHT
jgi:hypothetical protein